MRARIFILLTLVSRCRSVYGSMPHVRRNTKSHLYSLKDNYDNHRSVEESDHGDSNNIPIQFPSYELILTTHYIAEDYNATLVGNELGDVVSSYLHFILRDKIQEYQLLTIDSTTLFMPSDADYSRNVFSQQIDSARQQYFSYDANAIFHPNNESDPPETQALYNIVDSTITDVFQNDQYEILEYLIAVSGSDVLKSSIELEMVKLSTKNLNTLKTAKNGSSDKTTITEDESQSKPSTLRMVFGIILVVLGGLSLFGWAYILYLRYQYNQENKTNETDKECLPCQNHSHQPQRQTNYSRSTHHPPSPIYIPSTYPSVPATNFEDSSCEPDNDEDSFSRQLRSAVQIDEHNWRRSANLASSMEVKKKIVPILKPSKRDNPSSILKHFTPPGWMDFLQDDLISQGSDDSNVSYSTKSSEGFEVINYKDNSKDEMCAYLLNPSDEDSFESCSGMEMSLGTSTGKVSLVSSSPSGFFTVDEEVKKKNFHIPDDEYDAAIEAAANVIQRRSRSNSPTLKDRDSSSTESLTATDISSQESPVKGDIFKQLKDVSQFLRKYEKNKSRRILKGSDSDTSYETNSICSSAQISYTSNEFEMEHYKKETNSISKNLTKAYDIISPRKSLVNIRQQQDENNEAETRPQHLPPLHPGSSTSVVPLTPKRPMSLEHTGSPHSVPESPNVFSAHSKTSGESGMSDIRFLENEVDSFFKKKEPSLADLLSKGKAVDISTTSSQLTGFKTDASDRLGISKPPKNQYYGTSYSGGKRETKISNSSSKQTSPSSSRTMKSSKPVTPSPPKNISAKPKSLSSLRKSSNIMDSTRSGNVSNEKMKSLRQIESKSNFTVATEHDRIKSSNQFESQSKPSLKPQIINNRGSVGQDVEAFNLVSPSSIQQGRGPSLLPKSSSPKPPKVDLTSSSRDMTSSSNSPKAHRTSSRDMMQTISDSLPRYLSTPIGNVMRAISVTPPSPQPQEHNMYHDNPPTPTGSEASSAKNIISMFESKRSLNNSTAIFPENEHWQYIGKKKVSSRVSFKS